MITRFNFPTRIQFGPGAISLIGQEISQLDGTRALVVTDQGIAATNILEKVKEHLRYAGVNFSIFKEVEPNPTDAQVEAGAAAYRDAGCDAIIAVGGGSPLDAAKAIQIRINHHDPLETYDDLKDGSELITGFLPPCVAVPTTSGTGSEVSRSAVITIAAADRKVVLFSPRLMPAVSICDPELTVGLPPRITAETGMDALSHNLEAYMAKGYHPMADAIALKAIAMVADNLEKAFKDGADIDARTNMMMASTMGAVAFQKGLGVVHSLAHPLSSVAKVSHGLANSIMLPPSMRFNSEEVGDRLGLVAHVMRASESTAEQAVAMVESLAERLGLPVRLSAAGVEESLIPVMAEKAMADGCHGTNPRVCSKEDMAALYRAVM